MTDRDRASALVLMRNQWAEIRRRPDTLRYGGYYNIVSPHVSDTQGTLKENIDENGETPTLVIPFRPSLVQRYIDRARFECHNKGIANNFSILKGRRVGATTDTLLKYLSRCITRSGTKVAVIAQREPTALRINKELYDIYRNSFPLDVVVPIETSNKDSITFRSDDPQSELYSSGFFFTTANGTGIDKVRGMGCLLLHMSEVDFYDDPDAVVHALTATLFRVKSAELMCESTAEQGGSGYFSHRFEKGWALQGGCNIWEPGYKPFLSSFVAIFLPYFMDSLNTAELCPGVHWSDFKDTLDDYEKSCVEIMFNSYHFRNHIPASDLEIQALKHLAFRRAKLEAGIFYPVGMVKPLQGDTYRTQEQFATEYPLDPKEAVAGSGVKTVIPVHCFEWLETLIMEPILTGYLRVGASGVASLERDGSGWLRIYKYPWDTSGKLSSGFDPWAGTIGSNAGDMYDYSYLVVFDDETGEQVLEYQSQDPFPIMCRNVTEILKFCGYTSLQAQAAVDIRLPFFCEEANAVLGAPVSQHLIHSNCYPSWRIFREFDINDVNRRSTNKLGFSSTKHTKGKLVNNLRNFILDSYANKSNDRYNPKRTIIRSPIIFNQLKNFVQKPKDNHVYYEALEKGQESPKSKDDGVIALALRCWHSNKINVVDGKEGEITQKEALREFPDERALRIGAFNAMGSVKENMDTSDSYGNESI